MRHSLEAARELEQALQQLMHLLDSVEAAPAALEAAVQACDQGFEALRVGFQRDDGPARADLAQALSTNAIALDLAGRRRAGVGERIELVRAARRALRQASGGVATGESCDVAG